MFCKTVLCAAALSASVAMADFMVYTSLPIPTDAVPTFSDASASSSWTTMIIYNAEIAYQDSTRARGSTWESSLSSASSEVAAWVKTASNYNIPSVVTDTDLTTSMYTKPDWYTALPSRVRAFKEEQVSDQYSVVRDVISRHASTSGSQGAAVAPTPRAGLGAGFGAMAAVAAGVFL